MQCPSCQFQNMPGSSLCARCRTSLKLAEATIDVHPPRAKRNTLSLPGWARFKIATSEKFSDQLDDSIDFISYGGALQFNRSLLVRWIIPGWPQLTFNRLRRARLFFLGYLLFLLPGLLLTGTNIGAVLVGLAFSTHLGSIVDVLFATRTTVRERIGLGTLIGFVLFLVLYLPVGWGVSQIARPQILVNDYASFQTEDIVWVNQLAGITPGEFLHYVNAGEMINENLPRGVPIYRLTNTGINRVLAVSGQEVRFEEGKVIVDGELSPYQTSTRFSKKMVMTMTVPQGAFFIDPTGRIPIGNVKITEQNMKQVCLLYTQNVRGQVIFRSYPFSRITMY